MATRTTLRDVAAAAGVSTSAASLALSGSVRIAAATAERVRAAAARLGYVRDQTQASIAAGRFRHGRPALVAAWMPDQRAVAALAEHAATMGMTVRALTTDRDGLAGALHRLGAAALVVAQRGPTAGLERLGLPVVSWTDEGEGEPVVDTIETCEWWTASVQAVARMRAAGHRRLAAVLMPASPPHWHDDVRAAAMRDQGLPVLVWDRDAATLAAFIRRHRPEAVVGTNIHVWLALEELGRPPPFAALQTFDTPWHRVCAGWRENAPRRIRLTLELIEQRLRYGERPPCRIVIVPTWRDGPSLRPAAQK